MDYNSKYSYALAAFVMALLDFPFSVSRSRSGGAMVNIAICLGLIFVFWISHNSALALGNYGHLPPLVGAWSPILIIGSLAFYFIRRARV